MTNWNEMTAEQKEEYELHIQLFGDAISICQNILNSRYAECDKKHKKPRDNFCNYCYRHIDYDKSRVVKQTREEIKQIHKEREKLPWTQRPMDAPVMVGKLEDARKRQESEDYLHGPLKLMDELTKSGELEKLMAPVLERLNENQRVKAAAFFKE